jgi:hypothetical protein
VKVCFVAVRHTGTVPNLGTMIWSTIFSNFAWPHNTGCKTSRRLVAKLLIKLRLVDHSKIQDIMVTTLYTRHRATRHLAEMFQFFLSLY